MKASVLTRYGSPDVLHLRDVPKPTRKENEILVRMYATPVNYCDLTSNEFNVPAPLFLPARLSFGWSKPQNNILGSELSGQLDRLLHYATNLNIRSESYRLKGKRRAGLLGRAMPESQPGSKVNREPQHQPVDIDGDGQRTFYTDDR